MRRIGSHSLGEFPQPSSASTASAAAEPGARSPAGLHSPMRRKVHGLGRFGGESRRGDAASVGPSRAFDHHPVRAIRARCCHSNAKTPHPCSSRGSIASIAFLQRSEIVI